MVPAITSSTRITLVSVTNDTLRDLADLHARVFPIAYGQKFYNEVLNAGELAKMGKYWTFSYTIFMHLKQEIG